MCLNPVQAVPAGSWGWGGGSTELLYPPECSQIALEFGNISLFGPHYHVRKEREESHTFPFLFWAPL